MIDKNLFDPIDWSELNPNFNLKGNPRVEDECREEISSPDCYKIFFENDVNSDSKSGSDWSKVKIDLYYTIFIRTAINDASGYDLLLDLLNIVQILFDFQALKLLTAMVLFFKVKVFELHFITKKLFLFPIYVLCLAGFAFHVKFIFDQVRNSRLVFSNYYEELKFQPMPELNFCFQKFKEFNQTGYSSRPITGNYLEKVTHEIRADTVFSSIRYLTAKNEWLELNMSDVPTNKARFRKQGVTFERFYFTDKKCLSIWTNQNYQRSRFFFDDTSDGSYEVMHVNFNQTFIENDQKNQLVVFYTRTGKRYLSDIKFLNYSSSSLEFEGSKVGFTALHEHSGKQLTLPVFKAG